MAPKILRAWQRRLLSREVWTDLELIGAYCEVDPKLVLPPEFLWDPDQTKAAQEFAFLIRLGSLQVEYTDGTSGRYKVRQDQVVRWAQLAAPDKWFAKPPTPTLGTRIDHYRRLCGWTVDQLAEAVGLQKSSVNAHRMGRSQPRPKQLDTYAQTFTEKLGYVVTIADLLSDETVTT